MNQFEEDAVITYFSRNCNAGLLDCSWQLAAAELALCRDRGPTAQVGGPETAGKDDQRYQEPLQKDHEVATHRPSFWSASRDVGSSCILRRTEETCGAEKMIKRSRMTSARKIEANRLNAKRSTGPKTEAGKAKSSRNARQHGLSRRTMEEGAVSDPLSRSAINGRFEQQQDSFDVDDLVRASLRLSRIRQARRDLLVELLEAPCPKLVKRLAGLERYEKPVRAAQRRSLRGLLK